MMNTRKRVAAVATGAALTFLVGGVAFAYWTTGGSGTGSAATGNTANITIVATSPAVTGLYPGAPAVDIAGKFNNPNTGKVYVGQVNVSVAAGFSAQADASKPACTSADFAITQPAATAAQIDAGNAVGSWSGAKIAMVNNPSANQDNCKGVTVPLSFSSN